MTVRHKNKTLAAGLSAFAGSVGLHRFYLHGWADRTGWLHVSALPLSLLLFLLWPAQRGFILMLPLRVAAWFGLGEALLIGLTADEKWDARHNPASRQKSVSGWPLAVILVVAFALGAIALLAAIARTIDLLLTGGAYG